MSAESREGARWNKVGQDQDRGKERGGAAQARPGGADRQTQEVGADRGEPQPSATGTLAQPRTTRALATTAHAARAPHRAAHSACTDPAPTPGPPQASHAPSRTTPCQTAPPPQLSYILDTPLPPLTHHYQDFLALPPQGHAHSLFSRPSCHISNRLFLFSTSALSALIEPLPSSTDCSSAH